MPRKIPNIITIQEQPELRLNYAYEVLVKTVKIDKKKNVLKIILKNLDSSQYRRLHAIDLSLPAFPGNPVCLFLEACNIDTNQVGKQIDLSSLVNKRLCIKFTDTKVTPFDHKSVVFAKVT